jgi:hypothetical protein
VVFTPHPGLFPPEGTQPTMSHMPSSHPARSFGKSIWRTVLCLLFKGNNWQTFAFPGSQIIRSTYLL